MRIGQRQIGVGQSPYIIAELGVNHDGSVERALDMTRAAAGAGADAVKLQLFETDLLMSSAAKLAAYQKAAGETDPVAMLRRLELSIDDMARIVALAHELDIHAIVTVFSVELMEKAQSLAWDAYKIASPDIVHKPLLESLAATGKPMIISTGASTIEEVKQAVAWLPTESRPSGSGRHVSPHDRLALLQCVSCYPTPEDRAELGGIAAIAIATGLPTGYSDHTATHITGRYAVAAGAVMLEKHLTYDRRAVGPDHAASLEPDLMRRYVLESRAAIVGRPLSVEHSVRKTSAALGSTGVSVSKENGRDLAYMLQHVERLKRVLDIEQDVRTVSRQSLTTCRALPRGHSLRSEDLTFKRPGTGLLPYRLDDVLGRALTRDVGADVPLVEEDVS